MIEKGELEQENKRLKEERDNFMLKYAKAVEEKIVETNNLCTERNKLGEENRKLKEKKKTEFGACWLWLFFIVIYSLLAALLIKVLPRE